MTDSATSTTNAQRAASLARAPTAVCASILLAMALAATQTACVGGFKEFPVDPQTGYFTDPAAEKSDPVLAQMVVDEELGIEPKTAVIVVQDEPPEDKGIFGSLLGNQFTLMSVREADVFGEVLTTTEYQQAVLGLDLPGEIDARHEKQVEEASKKWKSMSKPARQSAEKNLRKKLKSKRTAELVKIRNKRVSAEEISGWASRHGDFLWLRWSFPGEPAEIKVDRNNKPLPEDEANNLLTRQQRERKAAECRGAASAQSRQKCLDALPDEARILRGQKMRLSLIDAASQETRFAAETLILYNGDEIGAACISVGAIIGMVIGIVILAPVGLAAGGTAGATIGGALGGAGGAAAGQAIDSDCPQKAEVFPTPLTLTPGFRLGFTPTPEEHLYPLLNALIEYMSKQTGPAGSPAASNSPETDAGIRVPGEEPPVILLTEAPPATAKEAARR